MCEKASVMCFLNMCFSRQHPAVFISMYLTHIFNIQYLIIDWRGGGYWLIKSCSHKRSDGCHTKNYDMKNWWRKVIYYRVRWLITIQTNYYRNYSTWSLSSMWAIVLYWNFSNKAMGIIQKNTNRPKFILKPCVWVYSHNHLPCK